MTFLVLCWALAGSLFGGVGQCPLCVGPPQASAPGPQQGPQARHSVGFGVGYLPGPGLRIVGEYAYRGLGPGTVTSGLGWSEEFFGSLGYGLNYLAWRDPDIRLSLSASAFTEYTPNRLLGGSFSGETDERRSGGLGRAEVAVRTFPGRHLLAVHLEGQRTLVSLDPEEGASSSTLITLVDLGTRYLLEDPPRSPRRRGSVLSRLRFGFEPGQRFTTFLFNGSLRQQLRGPFEFVLEGRTILASTGTPSFERASFGASPGVRGFRQDAAIGRHLWTLQTEVWVPVPGTMEAEEGFLGRIGRTVRLAAFVDVGGVYRTQEDVEAGEMVGAGGGVRLLAGPATLRLDWARGFGPQETASAGRLYVTVAAGIL